MAPQHYKNLMYLVSALLFILYTSTYTLNEGQQAILLPRNKTVIDTTDRPVVSKPGLHFKRSLWEYAVVLDTRLQNQLARAPQFITIENQPIEVDYTFSWRVKNPVKYLAWQNQYTGKPSDFLIQLLNEQIQIFVTHQQNLKTLLRKEPILIDTALKNRLDAKGIELLNAQVTRWILSPKAQDQVFDQMRIEQTHIAAEYLTTATMAAQDIRIQAEAKSRKILTQAVEQTAIIRNQGELTALRLYIKAAQKNPSFSKLHQALSTYRQQFMAQTGKPMALIPFDDSQPLK